MILTNDVKHNLVYQITRWVSYNIERSGSLPVKDHFRNSYINQIHIESTNEFRTLFEDTK